MQLKGQDLEQKILQETDGELIVIKSGGEMIN
jgi:hypothetical protein